MQLRWKTAGSLEDFALIGGIGGWNDVLESDGEKSAVFNGSVAELTLFKRNSK